MSQAAQPSTATARGSISLYLRGAVVGEDEAIDKLWQRYFKRLVGLARSSLSSRGVRPDDGEDVALDALATFYRRAKEGQFPLLSDREGLWKLLVTITARKATKLYEFKTAEKRHEGMTVSEQSLAQAPHNGSLDVEGDVGFDRVIGNEPTPEFATLVAEEFRETLIALGDSTCRQVAVLLWAGYTQPEIAEKLDLSLASVKRKIAMTKKKLNERAAGGACA